MRAIPCLAVAICLYVGTSVCAADPNTLTDEEKRAGFKLLFNGRDLRGWEPAMAGWELENGPWKVQDGAIYFPLADSSNWPSLACGLSLVPADFELRFEWKEAPPGASFLQGHFSLGTYGAMTDNGFAGRLYCGYFAGARDIQLYTDKVRIPIKFAGQSQSKAPAKDNKRPAGQWNQARMVCKGSLVQNWLNGKKVLEIDLRRENWLELRDEPGSPLLDEWFKAKTRGLVLEIGNAGVAAWYRNLKVRAIAEDEELDRTPVASTVTQPTIRDSSADGR
jgi:hypothetical protein